MELEERDSIEAEVRAALSQVRLVFETGFPDDLIQKAKAVVDESLNGRLLKDGKIRYPACWVLTIVDIARRRNGRGFWNGDSTEHLRDGNQKLTPTELANKTIAAFKALNLETFDEVVSGENALKNITPIFMHSGIPINNIPTLVALIESAIARHRIGAGEQINEWSRTPNGFGQLWRAAVLLLKSGGAIATDLLERINEALLYPERASESGLPSNIIDALAVSPLGVRVKRSGSESSAPRPYIYLDPYSCEGPILHLPGVPSSVLDKWRITGSDRTEFFPLSNEPLDIPLNPMSEFEVVGYSKMRPVTSRMFQAYKDLPIVFFKAKSGRLVERRGTQLDISEPNMLAIHHKKITSDCLKNSNSYPMQSGKWSEWVISDIELGDRTSLELTDSVRNETVRIVHAPERPHLTPPDESLDVVTTNGIPVYSSAPSLVINVGSFDPSLIRVVIDHEESSIEKRLSDLDGIGEYSLQHLLINDGFYSIRVVGPMGFGMPNQKIALIHDLQISQNPDIALPDQSVSITAASPRATISKRVEAKQPECELIFESLALQVQIFRATWATRTREHLANRLDTTHFNIGVDQITNSGESFFSIDVGRNSYIQIAVALGAELEQIDNPSQRSSRRTLDLAIFADTVRQLNSELVDLHVRINDGEWFLVGRVTATYFAQLSNFSELMVGGNYCLDFKISENRPFKNRVVRFWPLDRPWDPSFKVDLPDALRTEATIEIPGHTRSGTYRIGIRIEDPWSPSSPRPRKSDTTSTDITLNHGVPIDLSDPVDRLISAIKSAESNVESVDVQGFGHVLISLLDQMYQDEGVQGLMGRSAALVFHALERDSSGIVRHIVRALELNLLDRDSRVVIALALMPTVFEIEDKQDLSIPDEVEELVWSQIPWLAAILEPWDDKSDAMSMWARHLGWPIISDEFEMDETGLDVEESQMEVKPQVPVLREILLGGFDQEVRRHIDRDPEFWNLILGSHIGSLSNQPLSRDAEFMALISSIPKAQANKSSLITWCDTWNTTISVAHSYLKYESNRQLIDQYDARAAWSDRPAQYKWILKDVAALTNYAVQARDHSQTPSQALIAVYEYLPEWVSYCLLLSLSLAPYNRNK